MFHVEIVILRLLWKMFFSLLTARLLPEGFSKVQIFQKIVYSLRKHFFRHPGQKNRLFEENVLLAPEVCSFNPGVVTPSLTPSIRSNHQSAQKSRFRSFVLEMFL